MFRECLRNESKLEWHKVGCEEQTDKQAETYSIKEEFVLKAQRISNGLPGLNEAGPTDRPIKG